MSFRKLYPYQEKYLEGLSSKTLMACGLGTGKTAMSIVHYMRKAYPRPLLIVGPAAKMRTGDWDQELEQIFKAYGLDLPEVVTISYEKIRLMDKDTRRPRWWQYTAKRNGGKEYAIIAEEVHACKNVQSKQSKALYEMTRDTDFFVGLSGTLTPNGWIDFAGYSKLFGYTKGITEFKKKYCNIQDYKGFPEIVGYYRTDELEQQLKTIAKPLSREQARELPSRKFIGQTIKLPPKDAKRYTELRLTRKDTRTGELLDNSSRLLSVLRQSTTESRLDNLLSIVNDTSDNIVIFYNYISERKAILKTLAKTDKQILRYDGEKHDELPASDADIQNTVLVAHYKSASTGLNLQWANVTIYFSLTYSYQEFEQSIGRTHRTNQTKKCLFYIFSVANTVDRDIWECLRGKRDFNERLWIKNTIDKV